MNKTPSASVSDDECPSLEPFFDTAAVSSELTVARQDLQDAMEKLGTVLQKAGRPSKSSSYSQKLHDVLKGQPVSSASFADITKALKTSHNEQDKSITSKVGSFIYRFYPVSKLVLGLTGTVASNAGFAPLQITANGIAQILEVSCRLYVL